MRWLVVVALIGCGDNVPTVDAGGVADDNKARCYQRCLDVCSLPEQARICQDGCDSAGAPNLSACGKR